eukprot:365123-Chlamydomonas_euryale.AAC.18
MDAPEAAQTNMRMHPLCNPIFIKMEQRCAPQRRSLSVCDGLDCLVLERHCKFIICVPAVICLSPA